MAEPLTGSKKERNLLMAPKATVEVVEHPHEWVCDVDGKVYDADKKLKSPAVKIVTIERMSAATKSKMQWTCEVYELVGNQKNGEPKWECLHPKEGTGRAYYKKQKAAFAAAFIAAKAYFHHKYLTALRTESKDYDGIKKLLGRLKDEARLEEKVIGNKTIPRHRAMEGDDLLLAEQILAKEFPVIAENLNVLFLFRQQCKGRELGPWESGKDSRGRKVQRLGLCKKLSPAEGDTYRMAFGYAPDFVITFCEPSFMKWKAKDIERCRFLIRHELCHIGFDPEKGSTWTVKHDLEEFEKAVTMTAPQAIPGDRVSFLRNAVHHFTNARQMSMLEMLGETDESPSPVTVEPKKKGRKAKKAEAAAPEQEELRGEERAREQGRQAARECNADPDTYHDNPYVKPSYKNAWDEGFEEVLGQESQTAEMAAAQ